MKDPTDSFLDLARPPGSKKPTVASLEHKRERKRQAEEDPWDTNPKTFDLNGVPTEFFDITALSIALKRAPTTLRRWETEGVIPKSTYYKGNDPRGRRRLYTRAQIEGMQRIAREEGMLRDRYTFVPPSFTKRVTDLFADLLKETPK